MKKLQKMEDWSWKFPDYTEENRQITINNIINDTDVPLKEFKLKILPHPQTVGKSFYHYDLWMNQYNKDGKKDK